MDEEIERLVVSVRADTRAFSRDVDAMRSQLDGPFKKGVASAGQALEGALSKALKTGKLGFDDLKRIALQVTSEIAAAAFRGGNGALGSALGGQGGGFLSSALSVLGGLFGAPGRATGGPVSPGRAYMVGERGPEIFVPTASGAIAPMVQQGGRNVRVSIAINAPAGAAPDMLARSSRQVARAVRASLMRED